MTQHLFAAETAPSTANLDANFTEVYGLLTGAASALVAAATVAGVDNATVLGNRTKALVMENNTSTVGAGNDIVWQVGSSAAAQKWAGVHGVISGNGGTTAAGHLVFSTGNSAGLVERARFTAAGDFIPTLQASAPSLTASRQMVFTLTSDTNLRISVRGADGATRVANITLA